MLTQRSAMGEDVMTQNEAWLLVEEFLANPTISLLEEPPNFDGLFRRHTSRDEVSPKQWADGYLAAFAEGHRITLVTFDRGLAGRMPDALLLAGK